MPRRGCLAEVALANRQIRPATGDLMEPLANKERKHDFTNSPAASFKPAILFLYRLLEHGA